MKYQSGHIRTTSLICLIFHLIQIRRQRTSQVNSPFLKMHRIRNCAATLLLAVFLLPGCGRDNGMPRDLTEHLKARDIIIQPTRINAPVSKRGGFVVTRYDAKVAAKIIATFSLKEIPADDTHWVVTAQAVGSTVTAKEIWGAPGRPSQFKLKDGGQFEYFYLLVTPDGEMYLFAEYAYG